MALAPATLVPRPGMQFPTACNGSNHMIPLAGPIRVTMDIVTHVLEPFKVTCNDTTIEIKKRSPFKATSSVAQNLNGSCCRELCLI